MQTLRDHRSAAFGPSDQLQGLAHGPRCFCLYYPGPKMDAIMCLSLQKFCPNNTHHGAAPEMVSSRKSSVWAYRDVELDSRIRLVWLFWNSGNPIPGSRTLCESLEYFHCSVIISLQSICHIWSPLEFLASEFSALLQSEDLEDLMQLCSNNKQKRQQQHLCVILWNLFICYF